MTSTAYLTQVEWLTLTRPSALLCRLGSQITDSCSPVRWTAGRKIPTLRLLLHVTLSWRPLRRSALPNSAATSTGRWRNGKTSQSKCCRVTLFVGYLMTVNNVKGILFPHFGGPQVQIAQVVGPVVSPRSPSCCGRFSGSWWSGCCHGGFSNLKDFSYHQGALFILINV